MNIDPSDSFYQQLDAEQALDRHGLDLVRQARELLRTQPSMRVAGLIAMRDASEAALIRAAQAVGPNQPSGPLTAIIKRRDVEPMLTKTFGTEQWLEPAGEPQQRLAVIVATRDGFKCGFYSLAAGASGAASH